MSRINFQLRELDRIVPWGEREKGGNLHWFALTDALLWITAGKSTIYEYSEAALERWKEYENNPKYNDYYLILFIF